MGLQIRDYELRNYKKKAILELIETKVCDKAIESGKDLTCMYHPPPFKTYLIGFSLSPSSNLSHGCVPQQAKTCEEIRELIGKLNRKSIKFNNDNNNNIGLSFV